eukprot:gb/GEZN01001531.1/.p1 GENE.gb/GEZN01001531.1/~~gb/GEZN01001531.1/.p1  ORF type:complete len:768 (-),score=240.41 gb/GEZN01001531.1/:611-2914(-)
MKEKEKEEEKKKKKKEKKKRKKKKKVKVQFCSFSLSSHCYPPHHWDCELFFLFSSYYSPLRPHQHRCSLNYHCYPNPNHYLSSFSSSSSSSSSSSFSSIRREMEAVLERKREGKRESKEEVVGGPKEGERENARERPEIKELKEGKEKGMLEALLEQLQLQHLLPSLTSINHLPSSRLLQRFAILQLFNSQVAQVLPLVDFSQANNRWSLAHRVSGLSARIFWQVKAEAFRGLLRETGGYNGGCHIRIDHIKAAKAADSISKTGAGGPAIGQLSNASSQQTGGAGNTERGLVANGGTGGNDRAMLRSIFGQAYRQLHFEKPASLRGEGQVWRVRYADMAGIDAGGLFRDSLTAICLDLQSPRTWLFLPCPNALADVGENKDQYIPNPQATSSLHLSMLAFVGKLMGVAIRGKHDLDLSLPLFVWRYLVAGGAGAGTGGCESTPLTRRDLEACHSGCFRVMDLVQQAKPPATTTTTATSSSLSPSATTTSTTSTTSTTALSRSLEQGDEQEVSVQKSTSSSTKRKKKRPETKKREQKEARKEEKKQEVADDSGEGEDEGEPFAGLCFTINTADGRVVELKPNGHRTKITFQNREEFCRLFEEYRLHEFDLQLEAMRTGLATIVPVQLLGLFTPQELELMVCGTKQIDIAYLKAHTVYKDGLSPNDTHIQYFWQAMESFSQEERQRFVRFCWGRNRLPLRAEDFVQKLKLCSAGEMRDWREDEGSSPNGLPVSHTCFFSLELPRYRSYQQMVDRLRYAINNTGGSIAMA